MQNRLASRKRFTPEQRASLLAAYRKSGLTQKAFASQAGISVNCLNLWLRKEKEEPGSRPVRFLSLPGPASAPAAAYKIRFVSGTSLEVVQGFALQELSHLCRVLHSL